MQPLRVFIGYDRSEETAYRVCEQSILAHASAPVLIEKLDRESLFRAGLYSRVVYKNDSGQMYDGIDTRPLSTEFSFSRFLVPALTQWKGVALFMDSDMLVRKDIAELFECFDDLCAVQVAQNYYMPTETTKMRGGVAQEKYPRKAWSSMMLFNCSHPICVGLTPHQVNHSTGRWLHQFDWCPNQYIGRLPLSWNVLDGNGPPGQNVACYHYTRGVPDVPGMSDRPFADEWWSYFSSEEAAD